MASDLSVVILAAGKGTRMRSKLSKVLHPLGGIPLAAHPVHLSQALEPHKIVLVVGHQSEQVQEHLDQRFGSNILSYAIQAEQNGTAHAVQCAQEAIGSLGKDILILSGDVPLLNKQTVDRLIEQKAAANAAVSLLSFVVDDPTGYGRIVRNEKGEVLKIQEHKDCNDEQRNISECNAGIYLADREFLFDVLGRIGNNNAQGEFYLTDIVSMAVEEKKGVVAFIVEDSAEVEGVNDRSQLSVLEEKWLRRRRDEFMKTGITMHLPESIYLDYDVSIGTDAVIEPNCVLRGKTLIGANSHIGAGSYLQNAKIPEGTQLSPHSLIQK